MLSACYSHKHISYRIRTIIRKAISNSNKKVQELISANPTVVERSDEDGWSLLHYSAKHGNLEAITLLLSKGTNFNVTTTNRNKPIHTAAEYGHGNIVEFFVDTKK